MFIRCFSKLRDSCEIFFYLFSILFPGTVTDIKFRDLAMKLRLCSFETFWGGDSMLCTVHSYPVLA